MKRWLSYIKRHVTPGTWVKPAKKRRPITVMPGDPPLDLFYPTGIRTPTAAPSSPALPVTLPLVPKRYPPGTPLPPTPPMCDTHLILDRYYNRPSISRGSSQALPVCDIALRRDAFHEYSFIDFAPTYTVTVSELNPYELVLRKPRTARLSTRLVSFFKEQPDGQV